MKFVVAILIFCIIVLFHEWGHFLLAKKNGIKVEEFSIGLGPTIIGFTKGETKYSIKLLPFGGACMMQGEDEDVQGGNSEHENGFGANPSKIKIDESRSFCNKTPLQRISVVAAGPLFNFLMAFIFSVILIGLHGHTQPIVYDVMPGYSAQAAGMEAGDEIIKMGKMRVHFYEEITGYTLFHPGEDIQVTYLRDGQTYTTTLEQKYDEDAGRYLMGIYGANEYVKEGPIGTLKYGLYEMKYWIWYTLNSLKMLVTGQVSVNDVSGPVGIVTVVADAYEQSMADGIYYVFLNMMNIAILLSANLGVMNLLPIPALDGGRLVFLIIELIRGKKVDPKREGMVHFIGLMCLLGLMVLVMANDVRKLFFGMF